MSQEDFQRKISDYRKEYERSQSVAQSVVDQAISDFENGRYYDNEKWKLKKRDGGIAVDLIDCRKAPNIGGETIATAKLDGDCFCIFRTGEREAFAKVGLELEALIDALAKLATVAQEKPILRRKGEISTFEIDRR